MQNLIDTSTRSQK